MKIEKNNADAYYLLGKSKLIKYDKLNRTNKNQAAADWCNGYCYKLTRDQIKEICNNFTKAASLGKAINPMEYSLCGDLQATETHEKYQSVIHVGPRGGRYTLSGSGNKIYIPKK